MRAPLKQPETLFIGQHCIWLEECASTNTYLAQMPQEGIWEGTCVLAHNQTAGRGQRNNRWEAAPHQNLTFSIFLKPKFLEAKHGHFLTLAVALGLADALTVYNIADSRIKWPNDLMLGSKKLAGLLIESHLQQNMMQSAIVGIGLNVNQMDFMHHEAISLAQYTGRHYDLSALFARLAEHLEKRYLQLKKQEFQQLTDDYHGLLFGLNETRLFRDVQQNTNFEAKVLGINSEGALMLQTQETVRLFFSKEVVWL